MMSEEEVRQYWERRYRETHEWLAKSRMREAEWKTSFNNLTGQARKLMQKISELQLERDRLREALEDIKTEAANADNEGYEGQYKSRRWIARIAAAALYPRCVCGHSKEQHEGHTQVPDRPTPSHCSAGCGCRAYNALAAKEPDAALAEHDRAVERRTAELCMEIAAASGHPYMVSAIRLKFDLYPTPAAPVTPLHNSATREAATPYQQKGEPTGT
jgi:hypothetical protein